MLTEYGKNKLIITFSLLLIAICGCSTPHRKIATSTLSDIPKIIEDVKGVNVADKDGQTLLMLSAALNSDPEVINSLIEKGADVNAKDKYGKTALMHASQANKNPEVAKRLLKNGAKINEKDNGKNTSLIYATANNNLELVKELIKNKAEVNVENHKKYTPLLYAMINANHTMVNFLIGKGASKDNLNKHLFLAVNSDPLNIDLIDILIEKGANVNAKDSGWTPLSVLISDREYKNTTIDQHREAIRLLVVNGAKVDKNLYSNTNISFKKQRLSYSRTGVETAIKSFERERNANLSRANAKRNKIKEDARRNEETKKSLKEFEELSNKKLF